MGSRVVTATELKAKCLALLDEVDEKGQSIIITKRGHPIASLQPLKKKAWSSPEGMWAGKVKIEGDIVEFDTSHLWAALRRR